eukprot:scaffold111358_cov60-Phaeocystis_antarctica.AAC.3
MTPRHYSTLRLTQGSQPPRRSARRQPPAEALSRSAMARRPVRQVKPLFQQAGEHGSLRGRHNRNARVVKYTAAWSEHVPPAAAAALTELCVEKVSPILRCAHARFHLRPPVPAWPTTTSPFGRVARKSRCALTPCARDDVTVGKPLVELEGSVVSGRGAPSLYAAHGAATPMFTLTLGDTRCKRVEREAGRVVRLIVPHASDKEGHSSLVGDQCAVAKLSGRVHSGKVSANPLDHRATSRQHLANPPVAFANGREKGWIRPMRHSGSRGAPTDHAASPPRQLRHELFSSCCFPARLAWAVEGSGVLWRCLQTGLERTSDAAARGPFRRDRGFNDGCGGARAGGGGGARPAQLITPSASSHMQAESCQPPRISLGRQALTPCCLPTHSGLVLTKSGGHVN